MTVIVPICRELDDAGPSLENRLSMLEAMVDALRPHRIAVKDGERIVLIERDALDWVESARNYLVIHCSRRQFVMRETLDRFHGELGACFLRVRRDAVVNAAAVQELHPLFRSEYRLTLRDGTHVRSTRRFRHELDPLIGRGAR